MAERLITIDELAFRLRVDRSTVFRHLPRLIARGLQPVPFGPRLKRYREASLDAMIKEAAERGEPLI